MAKQTIDAFISYAHVDDLATELENGAKVKGIITRIEEELNTYGRIKLGRPLTVWRDIKLDSGVQWSQEIIDRLADAKVSDVNQQIFWLNNRYDVVVQPLSKIVRAITVCLNLVVVQMRVRDNVCLHFFFLFCV